MWKVNIYIETSTDGQAKKKRKYGAVAECRRKNGELETREIFGEGETTYNQAVLRAVTAGLRKINQSCDVCIHAKESFVTGNLHRLPEMAAADFRNARGKDIKNREEWQELYAEARKHIITVDTDPHSYSGWMRMEMEERNV